MGWPSRQRGQLLDRVKLRVHEGECYCPLNARTNRGGVGAVHQYPAGSRAPGAQLETA